LRHHRSTQVSLAFSTLELDQRKPFFPLNLKSLPFVLLALGQMVSLSLCTQSLHRHKTHPYPLPSLPQCLFNRLLLSALCPQDTRERREKRWLCFSVYCSTTRFPMSTTSSIINEEEEEKAPCQVCEEVSHGMHFGVEVS
jgi:hypothetical protein